MYGYKVLLENKIVHKFLFEHTDPCHFKFDHLTNPFGNLFCIKFIHHTRCISVAT